MLPRSPSLNPAFNPDTGLVGVRVPDCDLIRQVCRLVSSPLALTSANPSSQASTLRVEEFRSLHSQVSAAVVIITMIARCAAVAGGGRGPAVGQQGGQHHRGPEQPGPLHRHPARQRPADCGDHARPAWTAPAVALNNNTAAYKFINRMFVTKYKAIT